MRQHIRMGQERGHRRLHRQLEAHADARSAPRTLIAVADASHFKLAIIYQGLDFERRPLPGGRVAADLDFFARALRARPGVRVYGKPLVIWSGTWKFSGRQIAQVTATGARPDARAGDRRRTSRATSGWPTSSTATRTTGHRSIPRRIPNYPEQARRDGQRRAARQGLWIAPAAAGFDARLIGGTTVVGARTARRSARRCDGGASLLAGRRRADQLERVQRELARRAEPEVRKHLLARHRGHPSTRRRHRSPTSTRTPRPPTDGATAHRSSPAWR